MNGWLPRTALVATATALAACLGSTSAEDGLEPPEEQGADAGGEVADRPDDPPPLWLATAVAATNLHAFTDSEVWLDQVGVVPLGAEVGVWGFDDESGWALVSPRGQYVRLAHLDLGGYPAAPPEAGAPWTGRVASGATVYRIARNGRRYAAGRVEAEAPLPLFAIDEGGATRSGTAVTSPGITLLDLADVAIDD